MRGSGHPVGSKEGRILGSPVSSPSTPRLNRVRCHPITPFDPTVFLSGLGVRPTVRLREGTAPGTAETLPALGTDYPVTPLQKST